MTSYFTDSSARQTFIIGLVEILVEFLDITDDAEKRALFSEMDALSDESLMGKKDIIDTYLRQNIESSEEYRKKVHQIKNDTLEIAEKQHSIVNSDPTSLIF